MAKKFARRVVAALCAIATMQAQTGNDPARAPAYVYDIGTVKPNRTGSGSVDIDSGDGRFSAKNVSLKMLLEGAYGIKEDLISGVPGAIASERFDVEAKIVDPDREELRKMTDKEESAMLLPFMVEHFHLKAHTEIKTLAVYELVAMPGGPKFKAGADQTGRNAGISVHNREMTAHDIPITMLASMLADQVHRTVLDKTGLAGTWDLALKWTPDEAEPQPDAPPGVFTAVQEQLGLKLQSAKGPVTTLVVDHVEMPEGN